MSYPNQKFAILENDQLRLVTLDQWANWMGNHRNDRIVARDEIDGYRISTTFTGLDYQWLPDGPPLYWETRIFLPPYASIPDVEDDVYPMRYSTAAEARAGHAKTVVWLKAKLKNGD